MKKTIIKALLCIAAAVPTFSSCELDLYPDGTIPFEESWEKVSDAENYYIGLMTSIRSISGGSLAYISEVQSDLFNATMGGGYLTQEHTWTFTNSSFGGEVTYAANYSSIYDANNIITNIGKVPFETKADSVKLAAIKGAAYFVRAFAHHNIALRYCKDYEPETADKELGLPLVTTNDISQKPSRSSLEDTYKFICNDLDSARKYMAQERPLFDLNKNLDAVHVFGLDVVEALSARVFLYMHEYDAAIEAAETIMPYYPLIDNADEFAEMWTFDTGSEIIFEPFQEKDNERSNSYDAFIAYNTTQKAYSPPFLPTQGLIDLYAAEDIRRIVYFKDVRFVNNYGDFDTGSILWKFPGNPDLVKQDGDYYNMTKTFRSAELYLIAAEAKYRQGASLDAQDYLNELRLARGLSGTSKTGTALWAEIKNEWVREMVGEGFRLDCLKRWHEGFTRMTPQSFGAAILVNQPGYRDLTIAADNFKFVWEIPSNDLQANTHLERNWPASN